VSQGTYYKESEQLTERTEMTLVELLQQAASESDTPNTSIEGKAANLIERQAAQIEMMRDFIAIAPVSSGVCCCGEAIDGHSNSMYCGHTPVDLWDHSVEQILATTSDQALEQFAARVREQCALIVDQYDYARFGAECAEKIRNIKELP
jgi:hypothetical protein